jgi:hypothetical protein
MFERDGRDGGGMDSGSNEKQRQKESRDSHDPAIIAASGVADWKEIGKLRRT